MKTKEFEKKCTRTYQNIIDKVPEEYKHLVQGEVFVARKVHELYRLQLKNGFYPLGMTAKKLFQAARTNIDLLDQHKLVRKDEGGKLKAVSYIEDEVFGDGFKDVGRVIREIILDTEKSELPDKYLIMQLLEPQAQYFETGNFERGMSALVNLSVYPKYPLLAVLLDRYDDPFGLKLTCQGIVLDQDFEKSKRYSDLVQQLLSDDKKNRNCRVVAGNVLIYGGPAAKRPWSANTLPSEEKLRINVGAVILLSDKTAADKYEQVIKPQLKFIPQALDLPNAESILPQAARYVLLGHEGGHAAFEFPEGLDYRLRGYFTTVKEAKCDAWGLRGWAGRVGQTINGISKEMFLGEIGTVVAWARSDIILAQKSGEILETREGEEIKNEALDPYSFAGAMLINSLLRNKGLCLNRGRYTWNTFDRLLGAVYTYFDEMDQITRRRQTNEGYIKACVETYSRDPFDFFAKTA